MTTFDPNTLSISFLLCTTITFTLTQAATFDIRNDCSFRLWAVADPGGSKQLDNGENWTFNTNRGSVKGRAKIWAQTNCNSNGNGGCQNYTLPPFTLAEYSVNHLNNSDFFDISLVKGFNVPMEFSPTSDGCSKGIKCVGDINEQCPQELLDPAGCNNACTVFENDQYCCRSTKCEPTIYSEFFKGLCPDAYSNPFDNATSTFTCPTGTNYTVVFCPTGTNDALRSNAFKVNIKNNCPYTIWPATLAGGQRTQLETGFELLAGAMRTLDAPYSPWEGRFWARTGCTNNGGKFACTTGDCGTGQVTCDGKSGATPTTLVEIFVAANKGQDFYDVSNVDGFTIPATIAPRGGTGGDCKSSSCKPDNLLGACPAELQSKGPDGNVIGCKSACVALGAPKYCCTGAFDKPETCPPTDYSRFFSQQCPQAYSYAYDDKKGTFTCNGGPDYDITFC